MIRLGSTLIITNTIKLIVESWRFVLNHKKILFFPVISFIICGGLSIIFLYALRNNPAFITTTTTSKPVSYIELVTAGVEFFSWYFICAFVITFFNVAMQSYVYSIICGVPGGLALGIRLSLLRINAIFTWSIISSTISLLITPSEKSSNTLVDILYLWIGATWHLVSYLIIPFLIVEDISPITALKQSIELLRKTAQDQLIGDFSVGFLFFIINLPVISLLYFLKYIHLSYLSTSIEVFVVTFLLISGILHITTNNIFQINYFLYLQDKKMPDAFHPSFMKQLVTELGS